LKYVFTGWRVVIYAATEGSDARRYLLAFGCRTGIFLNALTRKFLFFLFGMDGWMDGFTRCWDVSLQSESFYDEKH
jgi:hypothetical protein